MLIMNDIKYDFLTIVNTMIKAMTKFKKIT